MKTLKELFEIYRPKAKGEQDFVDKHVVIKHKDRNGNDDDVFNGKTKPVNRKKNRQGYDAGDDEKVYEELVAAYAEKYDMTIEEVESIIEELIAEEVEELDELSKALLRRTGGRMLRKGLGDGPRAKQHMKSANLASAKLYPDQHKNSLIKARVNATNEEVEDLDELSTKTLTDYIPRAATNMATASSNYTKHDMKSRPQNTIAGRLSAGAEQERYHGRMADKNLRTVTNRSTGISRAAAKLAKEEVELGEGLGAWSHEKLKSFANVPHGSYSPKEISNEIQRRKRNGEYNANYQTEEVEDLDESFYKSHGHTEITRNKTHTTISHNGNMGNTVKAHVKPNVDKMLGQGAFDRLKTHGKESGSPDYAYSLKIPNKHFDSVTGMKEEVEELGEVLDTRASKMSYAQKNMDSHEKALRNYLYYDGPGQNADKKADAHKTAMKRVRGLNTFVKNKVTKEEVEDLDEISKPALGRYIKAASHDVATRASATARYAEKEDQARKEGDWDAARKNSKIADQAFNKGWKRRQHIAKAVDRLTKEDVINRAIEKYIVSDADLPTPTERLLAKLDGLSESHIDTLVTIFEGLNEDNQMKMLYTAESHEGILSLLDFAIQNKGA